MSFQRHAGTEQSYRRGFSGTEARRGCRNREGSGGVPERVSPNICSEMMERLEERFNGEEWRQERRRRLQDSSSAYRGTT